MAGGGWMAVCLPQPTWCVQWVPLLRIVRHGAVGEVQPTLPRATLAPVDLLGDRSAQSQGGRPAVGQCRPYKGTAIAGWRPMVANSPKVHCATGSTCMQALGSVPALWDARTRGGRAAGAAALTWPRTEAASFARTRFRCPSFHSVSCTGGHARPWNLSQSVKNDRLHVCLYCSSPCDALADPHPHPSTPQSLLCPTYIERAADGVLHGVQPNVAILLALRS